MPGRGQYDRTKTPRDRRREQKERLLTAAARVFARQGLAHASVEDIIQDAGMSRRTFYAHFRDLRDLMLKLHERSARFALAAVRAAVESASTPVAGVEAGIRAFLELSAENGDLARVLFGEIRASKDDRRREALEDEFAEILTAALQRAHRNHDIALAPDPLAVVALVGAIETVAMRLVARREEASLRKATPTLLRLTLNAFR